MKRTTLLLVLLALVVPTSSALAYEWFWGATYGPAVPSGDTKDFIGKTSWRNFSLEGRKAEYASHHSFGLSFGWMVLNEKSKRTTSLKEIPGDVTGTQFRYLNVWPLLANADYYFNIGSGGTLLFVGANVGAYVIEERVEMGFFVTEENNWHFGGAPELGMSFPLEGTNLFFLTRYHLTTSAGNVASQQFFTFSIGFGGR